MMRKPPTPRQRGVAAVEFGLLLLPLVLMTFGATEFGRAIYTFNVLDKSVRDAARHLSQNGPGDDDVRREATCLAVYGSLVCGSPGNALAPGLTESNVVLCDAQSCIDTHAAQPTGSGVANLVTASINNYAFSSLVALVMPNLNFNNIAVTMRAQL